MQDSIHPNRLTRSPRTRMLAVATLASGVLVAGCAGSSPSPTAATVGGATTPPSSATRAGSSPSPVQFQQDELAFAKCMRSNGVPNFPDPKPGGGFDFHTSVSSLAFQAAGAKCQKLLPNGGAGPTFSAQALVQLRKIAKCMRHHGVSALPDPKRASTTSLPSSTAGYSRITDYRGVLLEFPARSTRRRRRTDRRRLRAAARS